MYAYIFRSMYATATSFNIQLRHLHIYINISLPPLRLRWKFLYKFRAAYVHGLKFAAYNFLKSTTTWLGLRASHWCYLHLSQAGAEVRGWDNILWPLYTCQHSFDMSQIPGATRLQLIMALYWTTPGNAWLWHRELLIEQPLPFCGSNCRHAYVCKA